MVTFERFPRCAIHNSRMHVHEEGSVLFTYIDFPEETLRTVAKTV